MKNITILALQNSSPTTIVGPMECFHLAGLFWDYLHGQRPEPLFSVKIASPDGKPVKCLNHVSIEPHCAMDDAGISDLVIISALTGNIDRGIQANKAAVPWLIKQYKAGAHLASICTGAFVLAETGLLNGKTATTHWGFADEFKRRYPKVILRHERILTDEGDLFCSGGSQAGFDLVMHLLEKKCGRELALQCAKVMVQDIGRSSQAPYASHLFKKDHTDRSILAAQKWLEAHYMENITITNISGNFGMSQRTFERRFKLSTGLTPLVYLQNVRLEAAKHLLETEHTTFDDITYRVGYADSTSFRKIFQRHTGLSPKRYKSLFQKVS